MTSTPLPSRSTTESVLSAYLNSTFRLTFPLLDGPLFKETITLAYSDDKTSAHLEYISARCCVFAFLSMTELFRTAIDEFKDVDTHACAAEARHLLPDATHNTDLTGVQCVLMLQQHETFLGRLLSAATLNGVACRMILMMGGHIHVPRRAYEYAEASREERKANHLRTMFWICYLFDKEIALRTSQPPFLSASYCDLAPPEAGLTYSSSDGHAGKTFAYLHGDIRISHLKEKVNRLLYSVQASRKQDAELLQDIRQLDAELEEWRVSLPPNIRPLLCLSRTSPRPPDERQFPPTMRVIGIHLEYFYLLIAIHHASGRCTTLNPGTQHLDGHSSCLLDSSLALCLEASRSTIIYLREMISNLASDVFWIVQLYPMVAIITLFSNILMNPLGSQTHLDLKLLGIAAEMFRFMPINQYSPRKLEQKQILEGFVIELARLGQCAVRKSEAQYLSWYPD
ncbi:transcriptional activator Mut3p [Fusarium acutatum]|uniref:Transcriptional activator Mut3p n=1 Tax=Fusarium acutatum TaxID=78861 RepID=A0A8H4JK27_9HYPO|nr:transcriptional activator Mut3p [Fusarium acutatum]